MSELNDQTVKPKKVGIILAIGIIFLPFIFAWILLKKGYSQNAKILGLGWLGICIIVMLLPKSNSSSESNIEVDPMSRTWMAYV